MVIHVTKAWGRSPMFLASIGFVILIGLTWLLGPHFGLGDVEARLGVILGIMVAWVVTLFLGRLLAARAGELLERMLVRQADDAVIDATADRRGEVQLLRQGLLNAIDTLKRSRIGKLSGKAALYELPWYMIIGHPAAGKSSAVLHSGLSFPLGDQAGIRGIGGTRNCDWFFSTEGILLDTAGRYATQSEDRGEWLQFLKLLKKNRPKAPVNGIIVTVSLPELADHRAEAFELYARKIRTRIHEIESAFGMAVPVYLLITKLDLLGGFSRFFCGLAEGERSGVWGATLPHEQGSGFDVVRAVGRHFDRLCNALRQLGDERLAASAGGASTAHFAFPVEFRALRGGIERFVELLHDADPYHARPRLRGVYFTSALQDGSPRIAAAARVAGRFNLSRGRMLHEDGSGSYSYFLSGLFRDVVFPDQYLVTASVPGGRTRWRVVGMLAGVAALALVSGALTWSFVGNQILVAAVSEERQLSATLRADPKIDAQLRGLLVMQGRLEMLAAQRRDGVPWQLAVGLYTGGRLEAALRKEYFNAVESLMLRPIKHELERVLKQTGSGSASGRQAEIVPQRAAAAAVVSSTDGPDGLPLIPLGRPIAQHSVEAPRPTAAPLAPVVSAVAPLARDNQAGLESAYNVLKTYLMLQSHEQMDAPHLADQLPRHWRPFLEAQLDGGSLDSVRPLAERIVGFYLSQIGRDDLPLIANDVVIVAQARDALRGSVQRMSAIDRLYSELRAKASTRFPPLSLNRILDGRDGHVIAGSTVVPGAFTRDAWEQFLRGAFDEAARGEVQGEDWVLASALPKRSADHDGEDIRATLEARYRHEFAENWRAFLQGIAVSDAASLQQAADAVGRLADPQNSPIRVLIARATHELGWVSVDLRQTRLDAATTRVIERASGLLPVSAQSAGKTSVVETTATSGPFSALPALSMVAGQPSALLTGYLEQMGRLRARLNQIAADEDADSQARSLMVATHAGSGSELAELLRYIDDTMLALADEHTRVALRPLLVRPLQSAYGALIPHAERDIEQVWQRDVLPQWRSLAARYPFSDSGNEASLADIVRFVRGGGTLDRFVREHLRGFVTQRGDQLQSRQWGGKGVRLSAGFLSGAGRLMTLGAALGDAGETSRFELQPMPTPGLSEIAIEIDGQTLRYRNGMQPWQGFAWPGGAGSEGARLQVVDFGGASRVVASEPGRMGFMRLLGKASSSSGVLEWRSSALADDRPVRMSFRMVSGVNPLQLIALGRIPLPDRITH